MGPRAAPEGGPEEAQHQGTQDPAPGHPCYPAEEEAPPVREEG